MASLPSSGDDFLVEKTGSGAPPMPHSSRPIILRFPPYVLGACLLLWSFFRLLVDLNAILESNSLPSVHLVLATTEGQTTSWTKYVKIPNLRVIPYIADNQTSTWHPPTNKGNEAIMYLTYLYEFYDSLPDISIFTHGQDKSWHIDGPLLYSTAYAINQLDLDEVRRRKYVNLRVSWEHACPNWINTSVNALSPQFDSTLRPEEPYMKKAFLENFPDDPLPEILSQPCCSQFAVSREAIRSIPREQYKMRVEWLMKNDLTSSLSGRVWEHLWQWMFLKQAIDCPSEYKALCKRYHICFESEADWNGWKTLEKIRYNYTEYRYALLSNGIQETAQRVLDVDAQITDISLKLDPWREEALERGRFENNRWEIAGGL